VAASLASERVIINAPMSFAGAAQRTFRLAGRPSQTWVKWLLRLTVAPLMLAPWWAFVLAWYLAFSVLLIPYRVLRRGARKRKKEALRHREMLAAIEAKGAD